MHLYWTLPAPRIDLIAVVIRCTLMVRHRSACLPYNTKAHCYSPDLRLYAHLQRRTYPDMAIVLVRDQGSLPSHTLRPVHRHHDRRLAYVTRPPLPGGV